MKLKDYFKKAQKGKWAIGQFNFSTLEQLRGILDAAERLKSPVILGTSRGEADYLGLEEISVLLPLILKKYKVEAFLNLDHATDPDKIKKAIDCGYPAAHFDGSSLEFSDNVKQTKDIVRYARKKGVFVEGELGIIKGSSLFHSGTGKVEKGLLTDPDQVLEFVKKTKIDSLAISIGNIHGVYKRMPKIDFNLLRQIREATNVPLVFHGSSGVKDDDVRRVIREGIVKANFNTEIRAVWKQALKKELNSSALKPYEIMAEVQGAVQKKVAEKLKLLGSFNKM